MDNNQVLNLFVKAENKIAASFNQLPSATIEEKSLGIVQIQQTSYFLEKINQLLFHKIVKDCKTQLDTLRNQYPLIKDVSKCEVTSLGIKFSIKNKTYLAPLVSIEQIITKMNIKPEQYSGKFVQISFILRPENYLDLCLILFLQGLKNV